MCGAAGERGRVPGPGLYLCPRQRAPQGAAGDTNALGFAFSQGQASGWWGGDPGVFTADQAGAAAKLLYDAVVWGTPLPAMDPGVLAAFDDFNNWFVQAKGTANAALEVTAALTSGAATFTTNATDQIHGNSPGASSPSPA